MSHRATHTTAKTQTTQSAPPATGFARFGLHPSLERGVQAMGFREPRPIQEQTIAAALAGRDVMGLAQTGTGKTAAFALPILDRLLARPGSGPRALIVAPTRELANQIEAEFRALARHMRLRLATIYGGVPSRPQIKALRARPDIVVACPGRLLDLMGQGFVKLGALEVLVLDEADHMFDMGFLPDIRRILAALPKKRQNLLFSATMPREIRSLAEKILTNPQVAELSHSMPAETIEHALYPVAEGRKFALLQRLLSEEGFRSAIVFTRTKHRAKRMALQLAKAGHRAIALQGNMSQAQRDRAMQGFRNRRSNILVATDIAARGIDVAGISHVINFDIPGTPDAYTHRIGRTGRAELRGKACTLITGADHGAVRAIERRIGSRIPRRSLPGFDAGPVEPGRSAPRAPARPSSRSRGPARRAPSGASGARREQGSRPADHRGGGAQREGPARPASPRPRRRSRRPSFGGGRRKSR